MDKERILSKIAEIEEYLGEIYENIPQSFEEYESNTVLKRAMERLLQITIEACIDTCAILVKELKLGLPTEEEDFLRKLENIVLSEEIVGSLKSMKKFRNLIVHGYSKINDYQVYEILRSNLEDIEKFMNEIKEFLREN